MHMLEGNNHNRTSKHSLVHHREIRTTRPQHDDRRANNPEQAMPLDTNNIHRPQRLQEAKQGMPWLRLLLPPETMQPLHCQLQPELPLLDCVKKSENSEKKRR